ncbi:MAG: dTMP kinase [Dehalococcoidia bacterium]
MSDRPGKGHFIVLEGGEGVGKTTQLGLLSDWLRALDLPCSTAREPGGTPVGEAIREVLLHRTQMVMPAETELLLMLAARAAFVREVVEPALDRGEIVVADRFDLSSMAYQGYGRGLGADEVRRVNAFATGGVRPDLYIVLDIPVADGLRRKQGDEAGADRIEQEGGKFMEEVRRGYLELAAEMPEATVVDASGTPEEVHQGVRGALAEAFPETFPSEEV